MDNEPIQVPGLCPLVIGITGHRDLLDSEKPAIEDLVRTRFADLRAQFPGTPLLVMTMLAEGADRLAARVALETGIDVQAVLPMPIESYREDFPDLESRAEFEALCARAEILELRSPDVNPATLSGPGPARDRAYANCGMFISAHCHLLLAMWDGKDSGRLGGTAQIVSFQHFDRLPGIAESVPRSSLFLTDDESDLVYHIVCSRKSTPESQPARPLEASWFTADIRRPRLAAMPERYVRVFRRMDDYNQDVRALLSGSGHGTVSSAVWPRADLPAPSLRIRRYFEASDALANIFQKRVNRTLAAVYALAVLTGLAFILYSDGDLGPAIVAFLFFLLLGISLAALAHRRQWHRKYLDYRGLAEGLRVQFYWALAGVRGPGHSKFAYDNFLRQRDMELGWIRNVMRVAGAPANASPESAEVLSLDEVIDCWIGSADRAGQFDYYRDKAKRRSRMNRVTDVITYLSLCLGILVALVLAVFSAGIGPLRNPLILLMGVLPLIAGVAEAYTQRKADRELAKQYLFMEHVFANARRRLQDVSSDAERREVLRGLGDAALTEHAEWILVHRERQPEPGGF